jgi:hypothetical protein
MATYPTKRTPDQRDYLNLTITTETNGLSDVGDLGGLALKGLEMSTAWTAADLQIKGSPISSANLYPVYALNSTSTAGVINQFASSASRIYAFSHTLYDPLRFIQLVSIAAGGSTATVQAAARTVRLLLGVPGGPIK